jgi:hypothetical protein
LTHTLDFGVTIMNEQPFKRWLSYAFSVVNGTGFTRPDDNTAKDLVGRLRVTPPTLAGFMVNVTAATGEQLIGRRTRSGIGAQYDVPRFKIGAETMRQVVGQNRPSTGYVAFGALRFRPATPKPHFRMLEFGARFWILNDPVSTVPPPPDEDGGPAPPPASTLPETTREFAAGINVDVTRNVRLMGDVIAPVDDRPSSVTFLTRLQVVF